MNKTVIYTAISGSGKDILREPISIPGVDYVCFTDQKIKSNVWNIKKFKFIDDDPVITAKHPKILPHKYFSNYHVSIWVDGNILPNKNIVDKCNDFLSEKNMALHEHPRRNCLYKEIQRVDEVRKCHSSILAKQRDTYRNNGMPEDFGLWECGVLFRRHTIPGVSSFMNMWWDEIIKRQQPRDQISFAYVLWKTGCQVYSIKGNLRKKDYVNYVNHINEIKVKRPTRKQVIKKLIERKKNVARRTI